MSRILYSVKTMSRILYSVKITLKLCEGGGVTPQRYIWSFHQTSVYCFFRSSLGIPDPMHLNLRIFVILEAGFCRFQSPPPPSYNFR